MNIDLSCVSRNVSIKGVAQLNSSQLARKCKASKLARKCKAEDPTTKKGRRHQRR
jgi:hypothetical protein